MKRTSDWDGLVIKIITKSAPKTKNSKSKKNKKSPAPATQELEFPKQ